MDVHLLIYDLSGGLARQMSAQLLGFQLDAIYHTSIEIQGREWVYDGGIINIAPGSSHLGKPMERLFLGQTQLPMDVVTEYIDSTRSIFTFEKYDLFTHNCNNFTDSLANFLLGKGIPDHIINMPENVLKTPMGRMLMPHLAQGSKSRGGSILGLQDGGDATPQAPPTSSSSPNGSKVKSVTSLDQLDMLLEQAKTHCAVVFFTSATCPPCKQLYPLYASLSKQYEGKATFIKIDIAQPGAKSMAQRHSITATPTILTFLKGQQENRWMGADPARLRGNVDLLIQMAHPPHLHEQLHLPSFQHANSEPVLFQRVPPLGKLTDKMGGEEASRPEVARLKHFIEKRANADPQDAVLPDMGVTARLLQNAARTLVPEKLFAVVELLRCALVDPRVSGFFIEENDNQTILDIIKKVNDTDQCPYALRLVTIHTACNMFSSPLTQHEVLRKDALRSALTQLIASSFLDDNHSNTRVAASSLLYNMALADRSTRERDSEGLPEETKTELTAALLEAISQEEQSPEALRGMLTALGHLAYREDATGEFADLLRVMGAEGTIVGKKNGFPGEAKLIDEVGAEMIGKGFQRP